MSEEKTKIETEENKEEVNSEEQKKAEEIKKPKKKSNPILWITRIVLVIVLFIFAWYVLSDRNTPYTDQARITELILPITPRVSGYLTQVNTSLHSNVSYNDVLFQIDTIPFILGINQAAANVDNVVQQMGAQGATIKATASSVGVSKAQLDRSQRNYDRIQRIIEKNPGAVSQADIDRVETSLEQSKEKLESSEANLEKAKKQLGVVGPENPQLRLAIAELEKAQLELSFTYIYAPGNGFIESFNIDKGYYSQAGQALATLVSKEEIWIQADFRENNLANIQAGDEVEFALDVAPGRIFNGTVRSLGYGVSSGGDNNRGDLPTVNNPQGWLRQPQRFPVIIRIDDEEALTLRRSGGQADVIIYTGSNPILNLIGWFQIRISSWLSYVR
jgi:multidrug resistance efflux pump